ncbi:hypothetical protein LshimejAT787_0904820 [Lyophyllum shimeji]|uniref:Uncharacterized protein n=1 Tax=Lyophyllum shimeji TaxID=47721 RepID=A0A9P3PTX5_LYOSH|nr:hypothetical protein LshimejAT787_0904820 [Lyophyllum shimeji]
MTQFYSEKRRLHSVGTVVQGEKLRKDCVHNLNHKKKKFPNLRHPIPPICPSKIGAGVHLSSPPPKKRRGRTMNGMRDGWVGNEHSRPKNT